MRTRDIHNKAREKKDFYWFTFFSIIVLLFFFTNYHYSSQNYIDAFALTQSFLGVFFFFMIDLLCLLFLFLLRKSNIVESVYIALILTVGLLSVTKMDVSLYFPLFIFYFLLINMLSCELTLTAKTISWVLLNTAIFCVVDQIVIFPNAQGVLFFFPDQISFYSYLCLSLFSALFYSLRNFSKIL